VPSDGTAQATPYGKVVSSPRGVQVSTAQVSSLGALHCSKLTEATPVPASVAVAVIASGSAEARLTGFGAVTDRTGAVLSTTTVREAETNVFPARSRVVTRRS
jgi:hypothetical protein